MAGPPLSQSDGATYFPVTLTPFLLPRLIPVPSIWSLILPWASWKTYNVCVTKLGKDGKVYMREQPQSVSGIKNRSK